MENEKIGIIIENCEECVSSMKASVFDIEGGIIGSGKECTFCVQDKLEQVKEIHAKISYEFNITRKRNIAIK